MSDKIPKTSQGMGDQLNSPSLNIIAELTKERVAGQLEQVKALDSKANFVLGAATALISAALVLQTGLLTIQAAPSTTQIIPPATATPSLLTPTPTSTTHVTFIPSFSLASNNPLHFLPLVLLILPYLAVMISAFLAYRIRLYKQPPDPETLYKKYLAEDEKTTRAAVYRATLEAYRINVKTISRKVWYLNAAFVFLTLETIVLAIILFLQSIG